MGQTSRITPLWTVQDVSDYLRVPVQTFLADAGVRTACAQDGKARAVSAR
jgi:hypothetical protein